MTTKEPIKTQLRVPAELHESLNAAALKSGRSMNAEIVFRLEESLSSARQEDQCVDVAFNAYMVRSLLSGLRMEIAELDRRIADMEGGQQAATPDELAEAKQQRVDAIEASAYLGDRFRQLKAMRHLAPPSTTSG